MNKVILIGNLTRDPELSPVGQDNLQRCRFGLAVPRERSKNKEVDFFTITVWRGLAENCQKYLKKGSKCAVVGNIQVREYIAKDGTKKQAIEINADEVEFLGRNEAKASGAGMQPNFARDEDRDYVTQGLTPIVDDSLPF